MQVAVRNCEGDAPDPVGMRLGHATDLEAARGSDLRDDLEASGIQVRARSMAGLAEEAPIAYKDVDQVVETVSKAEIAKKVARLRPVAVVKG